MGIGALLMRVTAAEFIARPGTYALRRDDRQRFQREADRRRFVMVRRGEMAERSVGFGIIEWAARRGSL
jgi:hypothetical protein